MAFFALGVPTPRKSNSSFQSILGVSVTRTKMARRSNHEARQAPPATLFPLSGPTPRRPRRDARRSVSRNGQDGLGSGAQEA